MVFTPQEATEWPAEDWIMARHRTDNNPEELKAVLERLAHVHSSCWTYEDKGVVKEIIRDESGKERATEGSFTTAFDREARRLRYEFKAKNPEATRDRDCIVWRNGSSIKLWTKLKAKVQTMEKFGMAVTGAIGHSGESAFLIPNLLARTEVKTKGLLDLNKLCLVEKLDFNGTGYFKIVGFYPSRSKLTFWVDVTTALILKVELETAMDQIVEPHSHKGIMRSGAFMTKAIITYSGAVNRHIEDAKFEIRIPEE
jgi:hypothetical protein